MPCRVSVGSSVLPPGCTLPCTEPTLSSTCVIAGAFKDATVSTVKAVAVLAAPSLPAASTGLTVMLCAPPVNGVLGVKLQLPLVTVAVPIRVETPATVS